jgi:hypothetical protein
MGERKVKVTVTYWLEIEVPDDWTDGDAQFYVEENHCLDNYAIEIARACEATTDATGCGICQTCRRGRAQLGHVARDAEEQQMLANLGDEPWPRKGP